MSSFNDFAQQILNLGSVSSWRKYNELSYNPNTENGVKKFDVFSRRGCTSFEIFPVPNTMRASKFTIISRTFRQTYRVTRPIFATPINHVIIVSKTVDGGFRWIPVLWIGLPDGIEPFYSCVRRSLPRTWILINGESIGWGIETPQ